MKPFITAVILITLLVSCKQNNELKILDDKAPSATLKSLEDHMSTAKQLLREGKTNQALNELTQSIRTYHNEEAYIMKSNILLQEKRYAEFLENTEDALRFEEYQTSTLMMHNGLGYELIGEKEKATPFYAKALVYWMVEGTTQENYRLALSQRPFLTAVMSGKEAGLKDFDNTFAQFAKTKQDSIIRDNFRSLLAQYDGSGMRFFYDTIDNNTPTY